VRGSARVRSAAEQILRGDDSVRAANALESAILLDHPDEFDELVFALSLYSPRQVEGPEYFRYEAICAAIRAELATEDQRD
jgi:hypothetical protein